MNSVLREIKYQMDKGTNKENAPVEKKDQKGLSLSL